MPEQRKRHHRPTLSDVKKLSKKVAIIDNFSQKSRTSFSADELVTMMLSSPHHTKTVVSTMYSNTRKACSIHRCGLLSTVPDTCRNTRIDRNGAGSYFWTCGTSHDGVTSKKGFRYQRPRLLVFKMGGIALRVRAEGAWHTPSVEPARTSKAACSPGRTTSWFTCMMDLRNIVGSFAPGAPVPKHGDAPNFRLRRPLHVLH
mmetsp:Transcript_61124/g.145603  ORF Transcript_61124/g.145603 Transcript_61124/m.145603 type:complete len:201 (+) Transcript_61124:555-1157(+)